MATQYLDFEKPIFELEKKIEDLKVLSKGSDLDFSKEINSFQKKVRKLKREIFSKLTGWQKTQLARHPNRPNTLDFISLMTTDFIELQGDRRFGKGRSIVGGLAKLEGNPVMIIGHQKGKDTREKIYRNFGMPKPEDYRKALRLMQLADKFNLPIITLLDTPGAYPGIDAEERGQAEAIARNIYEMSKLSVPIISVIIGEGGSGGALALGVGNVILMLENSIYSVISPEGCAAILWGDEKKVEKAAEILGLTANILLKLNIIDEIIKEPIGGAHCNSQLMASILRRVLRRYLKKNRLLSPEKIIQQRYDKFRKIGVVLEGK